MFVGIETVSAYVIIGVIIFILINVMLKSVKKISGILINVLFGGTIYIILNILGMRLAVNVLTISLIGLMGVPGVILVIIMKFVLGVM